MNNSDPLWQLQHTQLWYKHVVRQYGSDTDQARLWDNRIKEAKTKLLLLGIPFDEENDHEFTSQYHNDPC